MPAPVEITLLSPIISARLKYITRFISTRLGCDFKLIPTDQFNKDDLPSSGILINYGTNPSECDFNVFAGGLIFETGIKKQETGFYSHEDKSYLYPAPDGFDLPFDLFSACFFMLSRYEEYLPFIPDQYGRFEADQSLAYKNGFLEEPVIDQWLVLFKKILQKKFPGLVFLPHSFRFISTFDIDNPWSFRHKGFSRSVAGSLKALWERRYADFRLRLSVLRGSTPDPFDTYDYILNIEMKYNFRSIFFFLFADYDRVDCNYSLKTPHFSKLVQQIGQDHRTGIHPSLRSNYNEGLLQAEQKRYAGILGNPAQISRQHFLVLRFPGTYRRLVELGIKEDYSMGYASHPGFRAGTCSSFIFYDLMNECETDLVVYPFAFMDVTLKQYLELTSREAIDRIRNLFLKVKQVDGTLISLWHNESLSGQGIWKGWREVFKEMIEAVNDEQ